MCLPLTMRNFKYLLLATAVSTIITKWNPLGGSFLLHLIIFRVTLTNKQPSRTCLTNWCRSKMLKPVEQGSTFEGITFTGEQKYKTAKTTNLLVLFVCLGI